eukprot:4607726-Pleurochrysis_carterae.AAC.1
MSAEITQASATAPDRPKRNISTTLLLLLAIVTPMVAVTIGHSNALEGFEGMQLPSIGIGTSHIYEKSTEIANDTRRLMKEYPLTLYVIMAMIVITSS